MKERDRRGDFRSMVSMFRLGGERFDPLNSFCCFFPCIKVVCQEEVL